MGEGHSHHHHFQADSISQTRLTWSIALTLLFVAGEAVAGWWANSLALLSDAGHNFADAAALGISWYALWIAKKPSHSGMTFGYHRMGILAALVNAVSLVVIALWIVWEAIGRLRQPETVSGGIMIFVAGIALAVNVLISFWLHAAAKHDLNIRSAYLHMIGDAISSVGVIIAGLLVLLTGATLADPIVSFLIAGLVLYTSWDVLKESVNVLLEGTPAGVDMRAVEKTIASVPGVLNVHDLHVWTIGPSAIACSCHILVTEQSIRDGQQILQTVIAEVEHQFEINHTTIQMEVEGGCGRQMYCAMGKKSAECG